MWHLLKLQNENVQQKCKMYNLSVIDLEEVDLLESAQLVGDW